MGVSDNKEVINPACHGESDSLKSVFLSFLNHGQVAQDWLIRRRRVLTRDENWSVSAQSTSLACRNSES